VNDPEVLKIARLLRVEPEELAYLDGVDEEALRELHDQIIERLFSAGQGLFDKLAAAARIVPSPVAASLSQRAFGPLLTARMASTVDRSAAVAVAKRLPPEFLADVAAEMDPRRAPEVIAELPADLIRAASLELADREDYVTMGRFVAHLSPQVLLDTMTALDDEALVRIAVVADDFDYIAEVLKDLPDERVEQLFRRLEELGQTPG
jgi:hypothetical protein